MPSEIHLGTINQIILKFNPETIVLSFAQLRAVQRNFTAEEWKRFEYVGPEGRGIKYGEVKIVRKPDPHGIVDISEDTDDKVIAWLEEGKNDG